MRKIITLLYCCCVTTTLFAQKTIKGQLVSPNGLTIPFANIGIKETKMATVSDEEGNFSLQIPAAYVNDTLSFSSIGFEIKNTAIQDLHSSNLNKIVLKEKITSLQQVKVFTRQGQKYKLGQMERTKLIFYPPPNFEQGRLLRLNEPVTILNANIYIPTPLTAGIKVRINFYTLANGLPSERILEKSIIRNTTLSKKGWQKFNLTTEYLQLDHDFVVSFEFLSDKNQKIGFAAKKRPKDSYVRFNTLANWKKSLLSDCTMYVTVAN